MPQFRKVALNFLSRHAIAALSGTGASLVIVRVARASHFQPDTIYLLLSRQSAMSILLGTASTFAPEFIGLSAFLLWRQVPYGNFAHWRTARNSPPIWFFYIPASFILLVIVSLVTWTFVLAVTLIWISQFVIKRLRHEPSRSSFVVVDAMVVLTILLTFVIFLANDSFWLPSEVLVTADGSYVGYVVEESDFSVVLVEDRSRLPVRVLSSSITGRHFCRIYSPFTPPLFAVVSGEREDSLKRCNEFMLEESDQDK